MFLNCHNALQEANMKTLKAENPTLKHSQLQSLLFENWQKAAENPKNQAAGDED